MPDRDEAAPRTLEYHHLDVFTARHFEGNQLAVFFDARGLDARAMQTLAREMNFSESTFVLPAEAATAAIPMRIFTPAVELPASRRKWESNPAAAPTQVTPAAPPPIQAAPVPIPETPPVQAPAAPATQEPVVTPPPT